MFKSKSKVVTSSNPDKNTITKLEEEKDIQTIDDDDPVDLIKAEVNREKFIKLQSALGKMDFYQGRSRIAVGM